MSVRNRVMVRVSERDRKSAWRSSNSEIEGEGPKKSVSDRVMVRVSERIGVMARNSEKERERARGTE